MIAFFFIINGIGGRFPFLVRNMSAPTSTMSARRAVMGENERVQQVELLSSINDLYGGVRVNMEHHPMDSKDFATSLKASISQWKQQGKRGVWIKLPIEQVNLVEVAVKEGFRYHHAEPDYLMLVYWIPETTNTLPANASHRVGIGAFVMNSQREVLVVMENGGRFKGTGVWKFPTGVVNEGEDIGTAAVREVKEETGIDAEFVEVLAFRECHKEFFSKSDLFFVCMLQPRSFDIQKQDQEVEAAQGKRGVWIKLPIEQVNLVEAAVKEGFRYHHAEPDYLMLVYWIPETTDTLHANASHRVCIGAFVMNSQREVLVVMENDGRFKGTGVWKFPTGDVNEWMPIEDYAAQPFIREHMQFNYDTKICLAKSDKNYPGFSPISTATSSGKTSCAPLLQQSGYTPINF